MWSRPVWHGHRVHAGASAARRPLLDEQLVLLVLQVLPLSCGRAHSHGYAWWRHRGALEWRYRATSPALEGSYRASPLPLTEELKYQKLTPHTSLKLLIHAFVVSWTYAVLTNLRTLRRRPYCVDVLHRKPATPTWSQISFASILCHSFYGKQW